MKVPDGEFMFPLVDRYNRVRDGLAHDAIERAMVESLTNQDAEQADEPAGNGEAKEQRTSLQMRMSGLIPAEGKKFHYFAMEAASPLASAFLLESDIPKRIPCSKSLCNLEAFAVLVTGSINAAAKGIWSMEFLSEAKVPREYFTP